jgi:hypothetical protein
MRKYWLSTTRRERTHTSTVVLIAALSIRFFTPYVRLAALDLMSQWDPVHPLVERLDLLTLAGCRHERLGLPNDADEATVEVAKEACLQCRRERATAVSAAERQA